MLCLVPPETTGPIETLRLVPPETTEPTQTLCFTAWFPLKHNWRMALQTDSLPKEDWAYTACCDKQECQDSLTHTLIWMQLYFFPEFTGSTNLAHGEKKQTHCNMFVTVHAICPWWRRMIHIVCYYIRSYNYIYIHIHRSMKQWVVSMRVPKVELNFCYECVDSSHSHSLNLTSKYLPPTPTDWWEGKTHTQLCATIL